LYKGEQIISSSEGYIGKMMGSGKDTQYNGELILTDQRLVFYAKRVFLSPEVYKSMPLKQISSINFSEKLDQIPRFGIPIYIISI
jgi:hypothetical protein